MLRLRQATGRRPISPRVVTEAAGAGDSATIAVLERVSTAVGAMINVPDPDLVVIGGVVGAGILLLNPAQRAGRQHALPGVWMQARLPRSTLGADTGQCSAAAQILASADRLGREVEK